MKEYEDDSVMSMGGEGLGEEDLEEEGVDVPETGEIEE